MKPTQARSNGLVVFAVVLLALAVRLPQLTVGLPYFTDEAIPFRQAVTLWGWGAASPTANPHFFHYPSLSIYLHWVAQALTVLVGTWLGRFSSSADAGVALAVDPTPFVVAGRLLGFAADALSSALIVWWGLRSSRVVGLIAGTLTALLPVLIRQCTQMSVDTLLVPACIGVGLLVATRGADSSRRGLVAAGALTGLAFGIKYSALPLLALPIAAWVFDAKPKRVSTLAGIMGAFLLAFLISTPFAVLDAAAWRQDVTYEWRHLLTGHFGAVEPLGAAPWRLLFANLGPMALGLALLALITSRRHMGDRRTPLLYLGAMLLPALFVRSGPERYLAPALPVLALIAAQFLAEWLKSRNRIARAGAVCAAVFAVGVPFVWAGMADLQRAPTPVARAMDWLARNVRPDDVVVGEYGALAGLTVPDKLALMETRAYANASPAWRARVEALPTWPFVTMPFVSSGEIVASTMADRSPAHGVAVFSPAWRMNALFYEPVLLRSATVFVSSSSIRSRMRSDSSADFAARRWYAYTENHTVRRLELPATDPIATPQLTIDRMPVASTPVEPLPPPDWWLRTSVALVDDPAGNAAEPSRALPAAARRAIFEERVAPFLRRSSILCVQAHRPKEASILARLVLRELPEDRDAVRALLVVASEDLPASAAANPSRLLDTLAAWGAAPEVAREELLRLQRISLHAR